ncbi:GtrA family protein [Paraferrimonas sp. SM1919]|uniref:GtrA family protein n=1 Tax=Paraferrimonas sp. SM1919 TaxID=2662263 RepID=UPI0013D5857D|nr:GtrA family protein [Paraferrimonas sp. SM1919]
MQALLNHKLFRFAIVGGGGFIVDLIVFSLLLELLGFSLGVARAIAFVVAATFTWWGNRIFTFNKAEKTSKLKQWVKFFSVACFAAIPNFLVFSLLIWLLPNDVLAPYFALVAGILVGMLFNYFFSNKWVFKQA